MKETKLKFSVIQKIEYYQQVRIKITNIQLKKPKPAANNKTRATVTITKNLSI